MIPARMVIFILIVLFFSPASSLGNSLPQSIGALKLVSMQSGEEARGEIDRLHGMRMGLQKGYIGIYEGQNKEAKLWVSGHASKEEAGEAIGKMALRIKESKRKSFWHFQEIQIEGVRVYFVLGMGQAHYFFQRGIKSFWLTVDASLAKEAIRDLIGKVH